MSIDREALEKQALMAISTDLYYDLADSIDAISSEELQEIIDESLHDYSHCTACDKLIDLDINTNKEWQYIGDFLYCYDCFAKEQK